MSQSIITVFFPHKMLRYNNSIQVHLKSQHDNNTSYAHTHTYAYKSIMLHDEIYYQLGVILNM